MLMFVHGNVRRVLQCGRWLNERNSSFDGAIDGVNRLKHQFPFHFSSLSFDLNVHCIFNLDNISMLSKFNVMDDLKL